MQRTHFMVRNKRYTAIEQLASLKKEFNVWKSHGCPNGFSCWLTLTPSCVSDIYTIKIVYSETRFPKVYVIAPKPLRLAENATKLPHTYDSREQQLCLFNPKNNEWSPNMLISRTIVHWATEWLYYYEAWVFSGIWYGGGHGDWDAKWRGKQVECE